MYGRGNAINFPVSLYSPLCAHVLPPQFGGVPVSGACCHLLLITRCSCISKSPFRSRERGRAVNWALWERRGVWSWGGVDRPGGFL